MAIKELTQPKTADQLQPQPPFGRPPVATNFEINDMHKPGELVMLSGGLYRVTSAEKMSLMLHMGISGTFTRNADTRLFFTISESDSNINSTSFTIPAGVKLHLGAQGANNLVQVVTVASDITTGTSGGFSVDTDETINSQFPGTPGQTEEATFLFVPSASTDSTNNNLLLDKKTFGILESPSSGLTVYDLVFGISMHPKYTGRDGDITDPGLAPSNLEMTSTGYSSAHLGSAKLRADNSTREDASNTQGTQGENSGTFGGARFGDGGYGLSMTRFSSMISPKIRIEQPKGVIRFATDRSKGSDATSRGINKTGFLTAEDTSTLSLNPKYRIITNSSSQDGSLPTFQLLQDNLGELRDPHILLVGSKLVLEEVSEAEVKEMIRRSGKFNYKIIEDPIEAYKTQSDGITGPANGWKEAVEMQRGRKMSYQDYQNLIENITTQSVNQLYGTAGSNPKQIREDPRRRHRGI